ncbi:MAG: hypothetical protein FWG05_00410 [Kiritimatiellaeota bacterium]|nr:hypothetical protein [Kiritimatiellota bacterium]
MKKTLAILSALCAAAGALAQVPAKITLKNNPEQTLAGEIRWQASGNQYAFSYRIPSSPNPVSKTYSPADIIKMEIQPPANFRAVSDQIRGANPESAIPALNKWVTDYKMLEWDGIAAAEIAKIHKKSKKWDEIVKLGDKVVAENPGAAVTSVFAPLYWEALLQSGKSSSRLEKWVDDAIATASGSIAAAALNIRGDMLRADKKLKEALVDGYLRVALMYTKEGETNAEALYKAAEVFSELGQSSYAEKMRAQLNNAHRSSPWTRKLLGGS